MRSVGIIPARMAATRFPGKPMAVIHGIPMIGHVYFRSKLNPDLDDLYVATCDLEIYNYIRSIGGKSVMTLDTHERCTERTAEALIKIEAETKQKADAVVMIQGDEPMIRPQVITDSLRPLKIRHDLQVTCLMSRIQSDADFEDPNLVKVVVNLKGEALYFSRELIPSRKKSKARPDRFRQLPIISFKRDYLLKYIALAPTPLEKIESVDMMRILEHGDKIQMVISETNPLSVDTPDDLHRVVDAMKNDDLMPSYAKTVLK